MLEMKKNKKNKNVPHLRFLETVETAIQLLQQYDIQSSISTIVARLILLIFCG
jgi:hypothetical protein